MSECPKCKIDIECETEKNSIIKCEICEKIYHQQCSGVARTVFKALALSKNLTWFCDECCDEGGFVKIVMERLRKLDEKLSENENKWKEQKTIISDIKKKIGGNAIQTSAVQRGAKRPWDRVDSADNTPLSSIIQQQASEKNERQAKKFCPITVNAPKTNDDKVLIIKAKNDDDKVNTESKIKSVLDPVNDEVKNIRKTAKGSVVITFKKVENVEAARKKLDSNMGENFEINEPKIFEPVVKVVGFEKEYLDRDKFISAIKAQNKDIFDQSAKIELIYNNQMKNKDTCTASLRIDLMSFKKVMKSERVNIGWSRCRIYEHVDVMRCYKCNGYGHIAQNCKCENFACPLCAGDHQLQDCKADPQNHKCINCIRENSKTNYDADVNHCALSTKCPILLKKIEKRKMKIRYEK